MRRFSAVLLAAALAGSPAVAQLRSAPAAAAAVRVPAAVGLLGVFRAELERGLGLPAGASAPIPLQRLHLQAVAAQRAGTVAAPALSPAGHAKMALIVRALADAPAAPAARAEAANPAGPAARSGLAAMEAALSSLRLEDLKDPAVAREAAASLWDGLSKRDAAQVPGSAPAAGRPGLASPAATKAAAKPAPPAPAPAARWPLVTAGLLAANAIVYLAPAEGWFMTADWRLSLSALASAYGADGWAGLAVQSRSFATAMFVHADFGHFMHNALGLALLGTVVERAFGHLRAAALYFGAGLAAGAVWAAANWGVFMGSMGASGAVMGLAGAFLAYYALDLHRRPSRSGWQEFWMLPLSMLAAVVVFQALGDVWGVAERWSQALGLSTGPLGRTNHLSHLVGLLAGLLSTRLWLRRPRPAR